MAQLLADPDAEERSQEAKSLMFFKALRVNHRTQFQGFQKVGISSTESTQILVEIIGHDHHMIPTLNEGRKCVRSWIIH